MYVPVDVASLTPEQVATVRAFVNGLNNKYVFLVGA